jgi:hypothetical protein
MIENLKSYHFKDKYTHVKNFVGICILWVLSDSQVKQENILGTYPIPRHAFEGGTNGFS